MAREPLALVPLAESIADGSPVDWDAAETRASDDDRAIVRQLRIVANLAALHRSLPADPHDLPSTPAARPADTAPAIGSWAHLSLVERLGGGSYGEVYRAWDRHLEREVALKLLRAPRPTQDPASASSGGDESLDDPQASQITREGRLLARVRHPNVITVHGVAVQDDRVGLWMELIRGATLEQLLLKRGVFSAREASLVGIDLCRALAAIHAAGLIHRDVKAQNVMREEGGRIVLMDLGTGREIDPTLPRGPQRGSRVGVARRALPDLAGTPLYLAPELFEGAPASERTDLYSLGVLLYHLVTGAFPVRATTIEELQQGHAKGASVRLRDARADLPTPFVRVVDRAIASDPDRRYASAGALEADLVQALDDSASTVLEAPAASGMAAPKTRAWPLAWRPTAVLATSLVALLVTAALFWPTPGGPRAPTAVPGTIRSVAVLPLVNLSGDPSQEYFADGMTDELIATLGRLDGLDVISRTSVMQFKGLSKPLPQIAQALHVDAVLEGSVLVLQGRPEDPSGAKRVRINARLIQAGTDTQLWNRTFETIVGDVLVLQSEVAKAVADGINLRLTSQAQGSLARSGGGGNAQAQDFDAFDLYLKGRYYWNMRTEDGLKRSLQYFQEAIDRAPRYALAYAGLADAYSLLGVYSMIPRADAAARANAAATKALEIDESLAEAHAALALFHLERFEWEAAEAGFKRALALKPGYGTAHHWYADYLAQRGRLPEALTEINRALALDPLSAIINSELGAILNLARRYDEAIAQLVKTLQAEPAFIPAHMVLADAYLHKTAYDRTLAEQDKIASPGAVDAQVLATRGYVFAVSGRRAEALKIAGDLAERYRRNEDAVASGAAFVYVGLNDKDRAFEWLDRAIKLHDPWVAYLKVDPRFDNLRTDRRFGSLLASLGLER